MVVPDRAARLGDVLHAGFVRALHIVAEGEEGVRAAGDTALRGDPGFFLFCGDRLRLYPEYALPDTVREDIFVFIRQIDINGVIPVGAADAVDKLQAEHLRVLPQQPVVGLLSGKACAVNTALLSGADTDGLPVLYIADRVRLGVLQRDQRHDHIADRRFGELLVLRDQILQQLLINCEVIVPLFKGNAENILALLRGRDIVRVNLNHVVIALFLGFQDAERFLSIAGGNDAVGDLVLEIGGRRGIADIAQRCPVAVGAEPVRTACADIGAGDGRELGVGSDKIDLPVGLAQLDADCGTRGRHVLEARRGGKPGGLFQLLDQLP